MSIRDAAQQALEALEAALSDDQPYIERCKQTITALRAALAEDAMQRLTDEQQMIERGTKAWAGVPNATAWVEDLRGNEPVTDCHNLEQARAVAISNLLAHFGITSADSNVNVAYLHKQLDDFLTAAIGCSNGGDKLTRHLKKVEECEYPRCLSSSGCERQCPAFPRCKDADTGETSDVPETNFGNMAQAVDCYGDGNVYRGQRSSDSKIPTLTINGMPAVVGPLSKAHRTCQESRQVEPVAWISYESLGRLKNGGNSRGAVPVQAIQSHTAKIPLYTAPPQRKPLSKSFLEELAEKHVTHCYFDTLTYARDIERAHEIGG